MKLKSTKVLSLVVLLLAAMTARAESGPRMVYNQPATYQQKTVFPEVLSPGHEALRRVAHAGFSPYHACWRGDLLVYCGSTEPIPGRWQADSSGRAFIIDLHAHVSRLQASAPMRSSAPQVQREKPDPEAANDRADRWLLDRGTAQSMPTALGWLSGGR